MDNLSVLVVDDHLPTAGSLVRLLRLNGIEAIEITDGRKAFQHLHSGAKSLDVYLVDLSLPGESGVTVIDTIRLLNKRSPLTGEPSRIIAYTAWPDEVLLKAAMDAGADAVVIKAGNFDHLKAVILGTDPGDWPPPERVTP